MIVNGWTINDISYMEAMYKALAKSENVCPDSGLVLHAIKYCQPKDIKVVILGQDPYHSRDATGTDKAWGLSFGYNPDWKGVTNSSMSNIIKELDNCGYKLEDLSLQGWARQGVLLLNTQLTVELDKPMSHSGIWNKVIHQILSQVPDSAIGLAWGTEAKKVLERYYMRHLHTSHPCRYSAKRGKRPFLGSGCFTRINEILSNPINWGS